ncbi:DUF4834 family protein [Mesonia aquimarina]|uniref:DUF4834 family protein n=1 Tax=Mesonia aquimarina TaxID=1504967 RepID=UPI000EF56B85|nr:DUF4834 family protein [Mesonia aquimarina]
MQEASFTGFIKTVFIILLVYFGIKIIFRWYGPQIMKFILRKVGQRVSKNFQQQQDFYNKQSANRQEHKGENIETERRENKKVGEYIDYEEID